MSLDLLVRWNKLLGEVYCSDDKALLFYSLVKMQRPAHILEIGTGVGVCSLFMALAAKETGLRLEVIRPEEEARLAVISCAPLVSPDAAQLLVFDIGGGSTELVWLDLSAIAPARRAQAIVNLEMSGRCCGPEAARIVDFISVPLGVATLHERYADVQDDSARFALMSWFFEEQIVGFKPYLETLSREDAAGFQMIGTSGTVTTVGAAHLGLRRYDRRKVDGMRLSAKAIDAVIARFLRLGPEGRRSDIGLGRDRSELIMSGAAILQTLLRIWPTESMRVADRGLREGMLFAMMSARGAFADGVQLE